MSITTEHANAIRALSIDAVERAKSGHPGAPMGLAEIAAVLWTQHLRHNPQNPNWFNRDRFVLSNGHGSMLLYALLHLTGYKLSIDDLKSFRQLHSKTPGHPEFGYTPGVETTTGPLGQGLANAVGMALAEHLLAQQFNRPSYNIIDHYTYCIVGDGCLMEGISHEVCSLAGSWKLNKLIVIYDSNGISIDGNITGWYSEDVAKRFDAYGFHVIDAIDGHDPKAIDEALIQAKQEQQRPSLLICRTNIGQGSPNKVGTAGVHGAPLGEKERNATMEQMNWPHNAFEIPDAIYEVYNCCIKGEQFEQDWQQQWQAYAQQHKTLADEFMRRIYRKTAPQLQQHINALITAWQVDDTPIATRKASQLVLNAIAPQCPELLGGSADLTGSNLTKWKDAEDFSANQAGRYIYYGVREFGMTAIANGIALHGGYIPFTGTFLIFMEYARNAVRMAALMKQPQIFVYTHDSIALGEDGPTHQPIEQLSFLRLTPNLETWRPADGIETAVAWQAAIENHDKPTALALSRQNLPPLKRTDTQQMQIQNGGYVIFNAMPEKPIVFSLIATGSEVHTTIKVAQTLQKEGLNCQVVSMPCYERFQTQSEKQRFDCLPKGAYRIVIEAGLPQTWYELVEGQGLVIGIKSFGESAPAKDLLTHFGLDEAGIYRQIMNFYHSQTPISL